MKSKINLIEAIILFIVSVPILIIGMVSLIGALISLFDIITSGVDATDVIIFGVFILIVTVTVFDIIAVIKMIQSLMFIDKSIKSYQCRVRCFLNLRKMLIFGVIADLLFSSNLLLDSIESGFTLFILFILFPYILIQWRLNENINILRQLIIDDIKHKRGQLNAES